ncbi:Tn3 family transposase [Streptomyces sp. NPDC092296]|uniref:Tn3 family transposase n=1 Tax=Streptomyces sp. NPDC092296 TaxID=3366012 RepID=UPI00382BFCCE
MFGREGHFELVDPVADAYRRRMNRRLTVQESRHTLARAICHGKRGHIQQTYQDGQEDQSRADAERRLWNARCLDAAVTEPAGAGHGLPSAL